MIRRPADMWPTFLLNEYRRLAKLPEVVHLIPGEDDVAAFQCKKAPGVESFYFRACQHGQDYAGLKATVAWLREGPKIVNVDEQQFQALAQVEVRLEVREFTMPYPSLLLNMPPGKLHEYLILHTCKVGDSGIPVIIGCSMSKDHKHDIVTVVRQREGHSLEESLATFGVGITEEEGDEAHACLRVGCNMALAMTTFGCSTSHLFPGEVAADKKFAAKGDKGPDGNRPSDRLREAPTLLTLDRTVKLWRTKGRANGDSTPTGRMMPFHWVKGHWKTQVHGPANSLRRRQYVAPYMVHADLLTVGPEDTITTYE